MASYPDLSNLNGTSGIGGFLSLPNASYPFFWAWILFGIWTITTLTLYFTEKSALGRANILSHMAVASMVVLIVATIGSINGFITQIVFIPALVLALLIIAIWHFSSN